MKRIFTILLIFVLFKFGYEYCKHIKVKLKVKLFKIPHKINPNSLVTFGPEQALSKGNEEPRSMGPVII